MKKSNMQKSLKNVNENSKLQTNLFLNCTKRNVKFGKINL